MCLTRGGDSPDHFVCSLAVIETDFGILVMAVTPGDNTPTRACSEVRAGGGGRALLSAVCSPVTCPRPRAVHAETPHGEERAIHDTKERHNATPLVSFDTILNGIC